MHPEVRTGEASLLKRMGTRSLVRLLEELLAVHAVLKQVLEEGTLLDPMAHLEQLGAQGTQRM